LKSFPFLDISKVENSTLTKEGDMSIKFAEVAERVKSSAIRELLKLSTSPEVISFAGGLPDPSLFPTKELKEICSLLLDSKWSAKTLQYGPTQGLPEVLETLALWLTHKEGLSISPDYECIVTTSSQQALSLIGQIFINPDDIVMCGLPTYLGALQAFQSVGAKLIGIPLKDDGWDMEYLKEKLKRVPTQKVKLFYVVPDFQNPSGIQWSFEKRKQLLKLAEKYNVIIVEDAPYRWISDNLPPPTIKSLDTTNQRVIFLFTFSKILAPALRLALVVAPQKIIEKLIILKQAADLCTSSFTQLLTAKFIEFYNLDLHIQVLSEAYAHKRLAMLTQLEEEFGDISSVKWTKPQGGLFLFLTLPEKIDAQEMLIVASERKVVYVPGKNFFCDPRIGHNTLRLNFSYPSIEQIKQGITILSQVIREFLKSK